MDRPPAIPGLRRAEPKDVPRIRALVRAAYGKFVPRIGREPKPMAADYASAVVHHQVWLVEAGGEVSAVLELVPFDDHLLVENIAIMPAAQGASLGSMLMAFAEAEARRQGFSEIRLYTNERFAENLPFYQHLGYRETHREPLKGTHLVHMAKRIDGG